MTTDDFVITTPTPPTQEQIDRLWQNGGRAALARAIARHVRRGLDVGTWVLVDGTAVPRALLHFYEEGAIMRTEEPCKEIAP